MAFRIRANPGEEPAFLEFDEAAAAAGPLEIVIDDACIDRLQASRLLRLVADRLLECDWPPDRACDLLWPRAQRPQWPGPAVG